MLKFTDKFYRHKININKVIENNFIKLRQIQKFNK